MATRAQILGAGAASLAFLMAGAAPAATVTPQAVAGTNSTFLLRADGNVWGWGDNSSGQLGLGSTGPQTQPVPTLLMSGVMAVSSGFAHTLFLKSDGTVWAVGSNSMGQLGDGTTTDRSTPVQVQGMTGVTAIAAGGNISMFLKSDQTAWTVGYTGVGLSDFGTVPANATRTTPFRLGIGVTAIAAGGGSSQYFGQPIGGFGLLLRSDTSVSSFGDNSAGQLGAGATGAQTTIATVVDSNGVAITNFKAISAGGQHSLLLKKDNSLWACGSGYDGQLGSTAQYSSTANPVLIMNGVTAIAAGDRNTLALKTNTLWGMGYNGGGQLGNGTTTSLSTSTQLLTSISSMSAGTSHSILVKTNGDVITTGNNAFGQLGDGTTTAETTPIKITNLTAATQTITFASPGSQVMSSPTVALTATASSGLPVTFTVTSGPATVSGSTLTLTGSGSVTVQATQTGDFNTAAATAVSRTFTVTKASQALTFTLPSSISLGDSPLTLAATASSGLAPTYTVVSGPATLSGNVLTLTGTGTVTVKASQAGSSAYSAASDVSVTFTVTPAVVVGFDSWASSAGLTGTNALSTAIPHGDGLTNLVKYAFNMNGTATDASVLTTTGDSGLPSVALDSSSGSPMLRVSYVRRKGSTLVYTPLRSTDLASFTAMTGTPTVTAINGSWERVTVADPVTLSTTPKAYARVQVDMP